MEDSHKVMIHCGAHHHPHAYRESELSRLLDEVRDPKMRQRVQYEISRFKHERHKVLTLGFQEPCEHLLRCHVEDTEYRALYGASQLMLSQAHGLKRIAERFEHHWRHIDGFDFSKVSPWLAKLHAYLATRLDVYLAEEERVDAMQNFGRTNEHASLRAECTNMTIRMFDDTFATSTRVSRWEPRLVELIDALKISRDQLNLIEAQNAIYANKGNAKQALDQKNLIIGKLVEMRRYKPLYMLDREVIPSEMTKDLTLDSDYNQKNLRTLQEMIDMFEGELAEIRKSKQDTAPEVIEGAIGAAVNDCISGMEYQGELSNSTLPTKGTELTRIAIKQVLNFRELDTALHEARKIDTKQSEDRVRQSWAIVLSHAIAASDIAMALRVQSAANTFRPLRTYKSLGELLQ